MAQSTNTIGKGSSASLFFADESEYGKPDWDYATGVTNVGTVSERVEPGANVIKTTASLSGISTGDWIATYTGDYEGVVQLFKVASRATTTITLEDETVPGFVVRPGDTIQKLNGFNPGRISAIDGVVSASLSVEIGSIEDESLGVFGGSRARGAARRGSITGDGGSFVVQPGIRGYGGLLKHALGCEVYYGSHQGTAVTGAGAANKEIDDSDGAKKDATSIPVDGGSGAFATGDVVRIGEGDNTDFVVLSAATATLLTFADFPLEYDHEDNEDVVKVVATTINNNAGYEAGSTSIIVTSNAGYAIGDRVRIGRGSTAEIVELTGITPANTLAFANTPLVFDHDDDEIVDKLATGVIPHEIRKSDLPVSLTLYQWHSDIKALWIFPGCRFGSYDLSASNEDATIKSTFNTVVKSSQLLQELPFGDDVKPGSHIPYVSLEISLRKGDERVVGLNSVTINGDNEITPLKSLDGTGTYSSAAEGTGRWSTEFNYQLLSVDRFKEAVEGETASWIVEITYDSKGSRGQKIVFEFPNSTLTGNIVANVEESGPISPDATLLTGLHETKNTNVIATVHSDEGTI